jgi:hypothetical protein
VIDDPLRDPAKIDTRHTMDRPRDPAAIGDEVQRERFRAMTPGERIQAGMQLFWFARRLKEASLRAAHPELSAAEIQARVKAAFLCARDE